MIDREARDNAIKVIDSMLTGKLALPQAGGEMEKINSLTLDESLKNVINIFLMNVDDDISIDCKEGWDYAQRVLLFLHSDAEFILVIGNNRLGWLNVAAMCALLLYVFIFYFFGFQSTALLSSAVGIGYVIWMWLGNRENTRREALDPFDSLTEMIRVRKSLPHFIKIPFPGNKANSKPVSMFKEFFYGCLAVLFVAYAIAVAFGILPVLLFLRALPRRACEYRIIPPQSV